MQYFDGAPISSTSTYRFMSGRQLESFLGKINERERDFFATGFLLYCQWLLLHDDIIGIRKGIESEIFLR